MQWDMALFPADAADAAETGAAFTDEEEEFFRAGVAREVAELVDSFEDLDAGYTPATFWHQMLGKRPRRAPTEPIPEPRQSSGSIVVDDDDEWEWQIAIARARAAAEEAL
jgi:hypothetical protein